MNLFLLIALLLGTQIGLSDVLILPTLVVEHGEGSFLAAYLLLKLLFILPVLQAELVAGRIFRTTPFEFGFVSNHPFWARVFVITLLAAVTMTLAGNLFNTSWAVIFSVDGLRGDLLMLRPLDQNLYWFEQSQNISRIMTFVIAQAILLMVVGGLAWRGISMIFAAVIPILLAFIIWRLPYIVEMLLDMSWLLLSFEDFVAAMQHALTSSMAGLFIWYTLGTKVSDQLPTGRVIIAVQLVDVLFGVAMLSISWDWISAYGGEVLQAGTLLRALAASLEFVPIIPMALASWLGALALTGVISSLPFLMLVTQRSLSNYSPWLLSSTVLISLAISIGLVLSHDGFSPLTWYGQTLYLFTQQLGQGVLVPLLSACISIWVGWLIWPNRVLRQVNPHGGIRYFFWRLELRFIVPVVLGLVFVRAVGSLLSINYLNVILGLLIFSFMLYLFRLLKSRAMFPTL